MPFFGSILYLTEGFVSGYGSAQALRSAHKLTSVKDQSPTSNAPSNVRNRFDLKGISHPLSLPIVYDFPLSRANVKSVDSAHFLERVGVQEAHHADHVLLLL